MPPFIEARELRKTYRVGKVDVPALRGISFNVEKGEFVTVVGPSGSGKSTLFYLLGGLTRADSGSVTIDGVDFATLSDGERTRLRKSKIGFVFQKFNLLPTLSARSNIEIAADLTEVRPHFQNVARDLRNSAISPTGVRAVFEAHGEVLTVPAEKGEVRNVTNTPGVMERTPAWSPDGKTIAYFSDESGEYALHIKPQNGAGETKKIPLAGNSAFYFDPKWSPDSKAIAFNDNMDNLWMVEIA